MELTKHGALKFDNILPMYNWLYPLSGQSWVLYVGSSAANVFSKIPVAKGRALYLHIPFVKRSVPSVHSYGVSTSTPKKSMAMLAL